MVIMVTGGAGFIGMHVSRALLDEGHEVVGVDNLNTYYDPTLKQARVGVLSSYSRFRFCNADLADRGAAARLFRAYCPADVVHLAAQAGVRYSLEDPYAYVDSNLQAFVNVLEGARHGRVRHLLYASSSSVYGNGAIPPFSLDQRVDHPMNLYAATKKANELMAHSYSHLFGLPTTGLRFFTVYGPWGRPDMAYFSFTKAILEGRPIQLFNCGRMKRDFTFIDDIVDGLVRVLSRPPAGDPGKSKPTSLGRPAPYRLYNIGNSRPVELTYFVDVLEQALGRKAIRVDAPIQAGDMLETSADISEISEEFGFEPHTSIENGIPRFVHWYREYYSRQT